MGRSFVFFSSWLHTSKYNTSLGAYLALEVPVVRRLYLAHEKIIFLKVCYYYYLEFYGLVKTVKVMSIHITKTCLYHIDPLKPHFYTIKLGFTGVYIIFLISAQNIHCGYSLEPPRRGGSNEYPQSMFWAEIWKLSEFFIWKFSVFGGEIFYIFE